ncbi:LANO_0F09340g1_1 [Lachancea nothofagi CBS 11611]|uniref:LANO_0F09340g1_1 n=1 Tax=Lachancea nothofagi CBS 11611 TaxID=1266666 RepID=A0A1G4K9X1_9SACH|nr:LANO_0F09340g1_1 [Lachancea nothofagi CBS 11611]
MITKEVFELQIRETLLPALRRWSLCQKVSLSDDKAVVTAVVKHLSLPYYTLEIQVEYSNIYQEPQLIFKVWKVQVEQDIEVKQVYFPPDLSRLLNLQDFVIRLDYLHNLNRDLWYSVHGCDTNSIVGSQLEHYLERWASIYLTIFDPEFSRVFID